jgi:two-component system phosphate regulon sensor histidine kinase PhoR
MEQVLDNLIVNAIKYSPVGSSVIVVIREKNNRVYIDVRDHGFGIPDGDLARIFERFYRVDKARARSEGGSGLGLSIVKHIVEAHGEEITVSSKERVGSVFTFSLAKVKR